MIATATQFASIASILGFAITLAVTGATYYQAFKMRQEARREREGMLHSENCLEFVSGEGDCINLVPLETLHSLPKAGDVIFLPADGVGTTKKYLPGSYLVESVEHYYSSVDFKRSRPREARLTKTVAKVTSLNPTLAA